jgi:hypothetical protein
MRARRRNRLQHVAHLEFQKVNSEARREMEQLGGWREVG